MGEWLKIMLEEIDRKKREQEEIRREQAARQEKHSGKQKHTGGDSKATRNTA